jgi:TonB-dependent SusC/RagA subfamily outer membrane receptor
VRGKAAMSRFDAQFRSEWGKEHPSSPPQIGGTMSHLLSRAALLRAATVLVCSVTTVAVAGACQRPARLNPVAPTAQRHFPGVSVVSTRNGGFYVRILSGLTANGEPLYIIDGNPMMIDPNRGIDWVNLNDIVEIKALKDPSELSIYGPRGINGVIVVTTKQGVRPR